MNNEQQQIDALNTRVQYLEGIILAMTYSDRFVLSRNLQLQDGRNIQTGRGTGTKIGTAADQKIGFFGKTPVVQQTPNTTPSGGGTGSSDAIDISARTAIGQIKTALQNLGLTS